MSTMRNSVMLIGRPGVEPEVKNLSNNKKKSPFQLCRDGKTQKRQQRMGERNALVQSHRLGRSSLAGGKQCQERPTNRHRRLASQQRMDRRQRPTPFFGRDLGQRFPDDESG